MLVLGYVEDQTIFSVRSKNVWLKYSLKYISGDSIMSLKSFECTHK